MKLIVSEGSGPHGKAIANVINQAAGLIGAWRYGVDTCKDLDKAKLSIPNSQFSALQFAIERLAYLGH